jgi:hypothetical protein
MHIRIIRKEYNLLLSNIAEELDKLRKLTFWGECTSEAIPLEKLHKKSEADINTHLQTIFAALFIPPRLGRKQKIAKACEQLLSSYKDLEHASKIVKTPTFASTFKIFIA